MRMYQLHLGDCFEVLKNMPDKSVDHIMTDPPYGERTHKGARSGTRSDCNLGEKVLIDFDYIPEERFYLFCQEAIRVSRRWVIFTCDLNYAGKIQDREKLGQYLVRVGCWVKPNAAPQFTGDRPGQGWEAVVILHPDGAKRWNGGGHHAVWVCNIVRGKHPTKKPPALIKKWLDQFTDIRETIFDPFMGEGTTGECCLQMGRNFIGVEIDPKWFNVAKKQIENSEAQLGLFEGVVNL